MLLVYTCRLLSKIIPLIARTGTDTDTDGDGSSPRIADVGGGTGNFTAALAKKLSLKEEEGEHILCVDPFEEMLRHAYAHQPLVKPVLLGAVEFAQQQRQEGQKEGEGEGEGGWLDCVLLKEVVHHIPSSEWDALFGGLFRQLTVGGAVVIITRPQEVEYPLFPRAAEIWKEHQEPAEPYCAALRLAGFGVQEVMHSYRVQLPKTVWLSMVENKFWSTFSLCTEEELRDGLAFLRARHAEEETLTFHDNLVFIVATKPASAPAPPLAAGGMSV